MATTATGSRKPGREQAVYGKLATGALMSGNDMYIATVGIDRTGRTRLVRSKSREFHVHGRDQVSFQAFTDLVCCFLAKQDITALTFVSSPEAGGHMAKAASYKIESMLQLLPITVRLVPSATLTLFEARTELGVPGPDSPRLSRAAAKVQQRAILAALYPPPEPDPAPVFAPSLTDQTLHWRSPACAERKESKRERKPRSSEETRLKRLEEQMGKATSYLERAEALMESLW